ncbi:DUF2971 domain-containing protein [Pseudomonas fluorescens]|uniref:DUF2971 domain-containing protein n=1 Tax=Pseudomonas fluorescens TaxID=294 RepID=A0A5E6PYT0_PSEFL|nr:DUF2971 domain-containing protein [Pseudomonas fluorescens]VVM47440.1 hypothetical protein PS659_00616 [Pseudomonas fluorescens]
MESLYHYTNQGGLIGVLSSKNMWATQAHFLNDPTEFTHALNFAKRIASNLYEDDYFEVFGWELRTRLEALSGESIFVASFSETPDLLSQWRGYCPAGSGYCLGFDFQGVKAFCDENGLRLEKCIYGHEEQVGAIIELAQSCLSLFPIPPLTQEDFQHLSSEKQVDFQMSYQKYVTGEGSAAAQNAIDIFCRELIALAPLFKNQGFHEEAEWRIIAQAPECSTHFRAGPSYVVPYVELNVLKGRLSILRTVMIGPNPDQHRCEKAAKIMLGSLGYSEATVTRSIIPFSNW